jgi:hypothetical protein
MQLRVAGKCLAQSWNQQANAALAFMSDVAPENTVEAALAVQMYATHDLSMEMMRRAKQTEDRAALNEFANIATKLARTFTTQLETLSKLRRGGEQVVKYVHVHEGGQAVVAGTIHQGGRVNGKGSDQPHGQIADAPVTSACYKKWPITAVRRCHPLPNLKVLTRRSAAVAPPPLTR